MRLSIAHMAGAALAGLTAAIAASYLGVAGTVLGAAVMSVITTVGTDIYAHYLRRTSVRVKQHATTGRQQRTARSETAASLPASPRRLRWLRFGVAAALVFTVSFGGVLIVQVLSGQTVADQVAGRTGKKDGPGRRQGVKERRTEPVRRQWRPRSDAPRDLAPAASLTPSPAGRRPTATAVPSVRASGTPAPPPSPPATTEPPATTPSAQATSEEPPPEDEDAPFPEPPPAQE